MKKSLMLLLFVIYVLNARTQHTRDNQFTYGFQLGNFHRDFGFGVHLLTPELLKNTRLDVRVNVNWLDHPDQRDESTWSPYVNNQVGVKYSTPVSERIQVYSGGGFVVLYPNSNFSSENFTIGGYGIFGFEFFLSEDPVRRQSYFFEIGGLGTSAVADRVRSKPFYANGLMISAGLRF